MKSQTESRLGGMRSPVFPDPRARSHRRFLYLFLSSMVWCTMPAQAATTITGSTGTLATVPAASGSVAFDSIAGLCRQSSMNTDPLTKAAYIIIEPTSATAQCNVVVENGSGVTVADVTTVGVPAVVYLTAADSYAVYTAELPGGGTALSFINIGGAPVLPALSSGSATVAGCSFDLERRSVVGALLADYTGGWNIVSNQGAANCTHTVGAATVAKDLVQVAIQDPLDLSIVKSVTPPAIAGAGESAAYSFLVTNNGGVPWTLSLTDGLPGLSAINCPVNPLPASSTTTCTATYTITAADVTAGTVSNSATVTGLDNTRANPTGASVTTSNSEVAFALVGPVVVPGGGVGGAAIAPLPVPSLTSAALAILATLVAFSACASGRRRTSVVTD